MTIDLVAGDLVAHYRVVRLIAHGASPPRTRCYPHAGSAAQRALAQMDFGSARTALSQASSEGGVVLLWDFLQPEDARRQFEQAIRDLPSNATAHYGLGSYWHGVAAATHDPAAAERAEAGLAEARATAAR